MLTATGGTNAAMERRAEALLLTSLTEDTGQRVCSNRTYHIPVDRNSELQFYFVEVFVEKWL